MSRVKTIMVVDDDEALRALLNMTLPRDGFEVVESADGQEAVDAVEAGKIPDLVLLDWRMPGLSGGEVLGYLKGNHPQVPVIVLTAEIQPRHRAEAEALGADSFLTKPFSPLQLLDAVERLLEEAS